MSQSTPKPLPAQDILRSLLSYDRESGALTWMPRPMSDFPSERHGKTWNTRYAGKLAGDLKPNGYLYISVYKRRLLAHRVIWAMERGFSTNDQIDHLDGNPLNNRLSNLRLASNAENGKNCKLSSNNTSGVSGVSWSKHAKKWAAQVMLDGKSNFLGRFGDKDEAAKAAAKFYRENGFTERHIAS